MCTGLASSRYDFTFVLVYDVESRVSQFCFTTMHSDLMALVKSCIRECPASPSALLLALCQIFKYNYLDDWSKSTRDTVNQIRTSIRVNPYMLPSTNQEADEITKFSLLDHMLKLTTLAQENAEHELGIAYCLHLLEAISRLHNDLYNAFENCSSTEALSQLHDASLLLDSCRSELEALRGIEKVHRSEIQPVTATVRAHNC